MILSSKDDEFAFLIRGGGDAVFVMTKDITSRREKL